LQKFGAFVSRPHFVRMLHNDYSEQNADWQNIECERGEALIRKK